MTLPTYVLITPARNEAEFISSTIDSVVAQAVPPLRWIIVSDGSTDGTDEIVGSYLSYYPWIELIRVPPRRERNFAGKVRAFNRGFARLSGLEYEAIGNLDADVSFDSGYFAFLLEKLAGDPALGVVGTAVDDGSGQMYDYRFVSTEHVTGTCQLFRRACFEQIGGYVPSKVGAIDSIAVISARMKGWKTRTFTDKTCSHHRRFGTAEHGSLAARFGNGLKDYAVGNHPCWEVARVAYQARKQPFIAGAAMLALGYLWAAIRRAPRPVSREVVRFHRQEQMERLRTLLRRYLGFDSRRSRSANP